MVDEPPCAAYDWVGGGMAICGGMVVTGAVGAFAPPPPLVRLALLNDSPARGGGGNAEVLPGGTGTAPGWGGGGLLLLSKAAVVVAGAYLDVVRVGVGEGAEVGWGGLAPGCGAG